jgi:hypothetical protein
MMAVFQGEAEADLPFIHLISIRTGLSLVVLIRTALMYMPDIPSLFLL